MKLKPLRDYNENDVVNLFSLLENSGDIGQLVKVSVGWVNGSTATPTIVSNLSSEPNTYSPRWAVGAKVGLCGATDTGSKPFGILLNNVRETNVWNYPMMYDPTRKAENLAVVSGEVVRVLRKGIVLVSGANLATADVGSGAIAAANGEWTLADKSHVGSVGEFLGGVDADGYALFSLNCYA